ncbi:siderophore-interacting protein [Miniimonas sp. S16]|uniref:siderophore-interacting protein n=1 Tax=Miniimonas sp. S16 TaxID=2171623 RepID=UPI000D527BD6|nr:siderophore-interacting protein [Miniimonas sp. S16]
MTRLRIDPVKPDTARVVPLTVTGSERISPHVQRVTLGGAGEIAPLGFDQWFRALVRRPGQTELHLLKDVGLVSYVRYVTLPESVRPLLRNYTVRELRGDELDVDVVVHGEVSPTEASFASWAVHAEPGDPAAVLDEGRMWNPPADTDSVLVVSDESGLPAVAGICRDLPRDARGTVILELPSAEDAQDLGAPDGVTVQLVVRTDAHARPGVAALAALGSATLPDGVPYVFAIGEQALATGARRDVVARGVPKEHVSFCGYWKFGARASR